MLADEGVVAEAFRQAAFGMSDWTAAIAMVATATRARIGQVAALDARDGMVLNILSGASADEAEAYLKAGGPDPAINPRTRAVITAPALRAITDDDFLPAELRSRSAIYAGLFREADVPTTLQIRLDAADDLKVALCLQRPRSSGEPDAYEARWLEAVAPAAGSAVATALALGRKLDDAVLHTAESLAGPTLLLGYAMNLVSLSPAGEEVLRDGTVLTLRGGRVAAASPAHAAALNRAFAAVAGAPPHARQSLRLPLAIPTAAAPAMLDLMPMPQRMSGPLSRACVALTIRLPDSADAPRVAHLLATDFGLTPAEAAVAQALGDGLDLRQIAQRRGASLATVRTQVKALLNKTQTHRQIDVALIARAYRHR